MKKLILITLILMLFLDNSKAQFSIVAYPPPPAFTLEDLWYLDVILSGSSTFDDYFITLDIFMEARGHITTAKSGIFRMSQGIIRINKTNYHTILDPIKTSYINPTIFQKINNRGGKFPSGEYIITFNLYGRTTDITGNILIENLTGPYEYNQSIDLAFPPSLIYPYHKDTIEETLPTFSWAAPFPLQMGEQVTFDLKIVEMYQNQTPYAAIKSNPPFFSQSDMINSVISYPMSSRSFDTAMSYVWQIVALIDGIEILESEIWTFVYAESYEDELNNKANKLSSGFVSCTYLKRELDGSYYQAQNGILNFKFVEEYNSQILKYKIFNFSMNDISSSCSISNLGKDTNQISKQYGDNRYRLECQGLRSNNYYILEITNDKNEKWYIRFKNVTTNRRLVNNEQLLK